MIFFEWIINIFVIIFCIFNIAYFLLLLWVLPGFLYKKLKQSIKEDLNVKH
jgi:uncharacterized membrane protein